MAGDWIKMRVNLADDPKVDLLSEIIGLDEFAVVGRLHKLWGKVGEFSETGEGVKWSHAKIDQIVCCKGFADALSKVGWLTGATRDLTFPNFSEHNGATAKKRAMDSARMSQKRGSRKKCDENATREEKRREEKIQEEEGVASATAPTTVAPVGWSNDGFSVCSNRRDQWTKAYPLVNIDRELARAHAWYTDNPDRRKRSHARFLGSWMRRAQDDAENPRPQHGGMQSHAKRQESYNHPEDFGGAA